MRFEGESNRITAIKDGFIWVRSIRVNGTRQPISQATALPLSDNSHRHPCVKRVVDAFRSNLFCPHEPELFTWIYQYVLDANDEYFHLADLLAYLETQEKAGKAFNDPSGWTRMAILNVARIGKFSSDRTAGEYARDIWDLKAI